jgi:hypothetical protein
MKKGKNQTKNQANKWIKIMIQQGREYGKERNTGRHFN